METQPPLEPRRAALANKDMLAHPVHLAMMEPMAKMESTATQGQPEMMALCWLHLNPQRCV